MSTSSSNLRLVIYPNVKNFILFFDNNVNLKKQLDELLAISFPDEFDPQNYSVPKDNDVPCTLVEQLKLLSHSNTIENDSMTSFVAYANNKLVAFAQLMREDTRKLRLINFCRNKSNYKGVGKGILDVMYKYIQQHHLALYGIDNKLITNSNLQTPKECTIYLTVDAENKELQNYYLSSGWTDTKNIDFRGKKPGLEYSRKVSL